MKLSREDHHHSADLLDKYVTGHASPQEIELIEAWYDQLKSDVELPKPATIEHDIEQLNSRLATIPKPTAQTEQKSKIRHLWRVSGAAACLLIICGIAIHYIQPFESSVDINLNSNKELMAAASSIHGGGSKAFLMLEDGTEIELREDKMGLIQHEEGIAYLDGTPIFENSLIGSQDNNVSKTNGRLIISTPPGNTYKIKLSDGSEILLNTATTISYPSKFEPGQDRVVVLDGEAYFSIKQDAQKTPFYVESNNQRISVLGTEFNVCAYTKEDETTTTLVSGSVRVERKSSNSNNAILQLLPNEQSNLRTTTFHKRKVNVEPYLAWKNGTFSFDNKNFKQVLAEIGRWYDLEITYQGEIPDEQFFGEAYRSESLAVILKMLESPNHSYELEGRKLIIKTE